MSWSGHLYTANQNWAEPSVESLSKSMVDVYNNFENLKYLGENAKTTFDSFSIKNMSKFINKELNSGRFKK